MVAFIFAAPVEAIRRPRCLAEASSLGFPAIKGNIARSGGEARRQ